MLYTVRLRVPLSWLSWVVSDKKARMLGLFWLAGSTCLPSQERLSRDSFNSVVLVLSEADKRWSFPMLTGKAVSGDAYLRVFDQLTQIRDRDLFSCRSNPVSPQDKIKDIDFS